MQEQMTGSIPNQSESVRQAIEVADKAIAAVQGVTSLSSLVVGGLGALIAILGVFGFFYIIKGVKITAKKVAESAMKEYIESAAWKAEVDQKIADRVTEEFAAKAFVVVQPDAKMPISGRFPKEPARRKGSALK